MIELPHCRSICPLTALKDYFEVTEKLRKTWLLLITTTPPYKAVSDITGRKWILDVLVCAKMDSNVALRYIK